MLLKQTKIVATISDQRCDVDFIKQLFDAGLNVVRMNTAHAGREGFEKLIANVRTVSNRIAILMDTKGPEVRTTVLDEPIPFKAGDRVKVVGNPPPPCLFESGLGQVRLIAGTDMASTVRKCLPSDSEPFRGSAFPTVQPCAANPLSLH